MVARRTLFAAAAGAAASPLLISAPAFAAPALPPVSPDRRLFLPAEQRYAPYLATLAPMVGDVDDSGFFGGGWWRTPSVPTNARVQEHVFTLSWFYANSRRWNPYFRDTALLAALDATIGHYLSLQHPDGSFPEYNVDEHGLAPTGFGIGYLAKTLRNLRQAGALRQRQSQITSALRTAMSWLLNPDNAIWTPPVHYANQVTAGLAGSAFALTQFSDPALRARLTERVLYLSRHGQSPAGFFYEPTGMDVNYNFEVMLPELAEYFRLTASPVAASMARRFADWFGHVMLREPDGSGWLTYYAVSARTAASDYDDVIGDTDRQTLGSSFLPVAPALAAFYTSREGKAAARARWAALPGPVPALAKQDTSPRIITHAMYPELLPPSPVKKAAIAGLPYLRSRRFWELRRDDATNQDFLFVRKPGFYFGAFFGDRASTTVKGGTGFLWHPAAGTVIHAQQTTTGCWATVPTGANPDAAGNLVATYGKDRVDYRTPDARVTTTLTFTDSSVRRTVRATTAATEQIPLVLRPSDTVAFTDGTPVPYNTTVTATADGLVLRRAGATIAIRWGSARRATISTSTRTYLADATRRVHVLRIAHSGDIDVTITA
ncbi:hypothetical protein ACQPZX_13055 [Actinoplanes sp. CA-142083]|uniref:hypothetical protein n=1 Tax=Actinoplanes sp. CA-142083 TaxID=3239903 RepID=UPI003D935947